MPRKNRTPESLALNRENQRRSRARHRELLQDLQHRVREFESRDAQASLEMQRVARVVAAENAALRAMLISRGVAHAEIETNLAASRSGDVDSVNVVETATVTYSTQSTTSHHFSPDTAVSSSPSSQTTSCGQHAAILPKEPSTETQVRPTQYLAPFQSLSGYTSQATPPIPIPREPQPVTDAQSACSALGKQSGCCSPPIVEQAAAPGPLNKMHCVEAATILARLRGTGDTNSARTALGCVDNNDCMVRNTDLLQLMDEVT